MKAIKSHWGVAQQSDANKPLLETFRKKQKKSKINKWIIITSQRSMTIGWMEVWMCFFIYRVSLIVRPNFKGKTSIVIYCLKYPLIVCITKLLVVKSQYIGGPKLRFLHLTANNVKSERITKQDFYFQFIQHPSHVFTSHLRTRCFDISRKRKFAFFIYY